MPLSVSAFASEKNMLSGSMFILLFELEIADGNFIRFARYDVDVTFEGQTWEAYGFGDGIDVTHNSQGEIPAYDIAFTNVGRQMQSILEFYDVEGRTGRLLWVHPDHLGDPTAKVEEPFVIVSARSDMRSAAITVSSTPFDPLSVQIPAELASIKKFPGLVSNNNRYML